MKNIDVLLGKQRQTHRSPAHLKRYIGFHSRKEAELCEIYRNGLRKPSNTGREIYIKNIITAPNIVNIHTTTIQFDGGPRRRSEHCDALLPRTVMACRLRRNTSRSDGFSSTDPTSREGRNRLQASWTRSEAIATHC